jgi:hypothetical protein
LRRRLLRTRAEPASHWRPRRRAAAFGSTKVELVVILDTSYDHVIEGPRMQTVSFVYWQEQDAWMGYLQEFPDYWTQGETLNDLKDHLRDLYRDLTSGELPGVRRLDQLEVA